MSTLKCFKYRSLIINDHIGIRDALPCGHCALDHRRNVVQNDVTTLFQLHFNVVLTSDARWVPAT